MTVAVCSYQCLCTLMAFIANIMDPDQTTPLGFIVFASKIVLVWSAPEFMQQTLNQSKFSGQKIFLQDKGLPLKRQSRLQQTVRRQILLHLS